MTKEEIIQKCLDSIHGENYLEIGVNKGESIRRVRAKRKWGVDPKHLSLHEKILVKLSPGCRIFQKTSDAFFKDHKDLLSGRGIDVALVDGLHTYEQALRDVENCLLFLKPNGFIVMHDCNPKSESMAFRAASYEEATVMKLPGWTGEWCGDVWKAVVYLRSQRSDLDICVFDCDYGVGVIRKKPAGPGLPLTPEQIANLSYADLALHKKEWLNLKSEDLLTSLFD
jgi:hypothetical protein